MTNRSQPINLFIILDWQWHFSFQFPHCQPIVLIIYYISSMQVDGRVVKARDSLTPLGHATEWVRILPRPTCDSAFHNSLIYLSVKQRISQDRSCNLKNEILSPRQWLTGNSQWFVCVEMLPHATRRLYKFARGLHVPHNPAFRGRPGWGAVQGTILSEKHVMVTWERKNILC